MAGVVAMASVIEDFEIQPCKKARKDDNLPPVKTITNYFMPVPKAVEKSFSPPRSNNIMDYFRKVSPDQDKHSSPQAAKENHLHPPSMAGALETSTKQERARPPKRGRKPRESVKHSQQGEAKGPTVGCVVTESSNAAADQTKHGSSTDRPDIVDPSKQRSADVQSSEGKDINCRMDQPVVENCKDRLLAKQPLDKEDGSASESPASKEKVKREKTAGRRGRKAKVSKLEQSQCVPEAQESVCDTSLEVNVDEDSRLNRSTVTMSFEEFLQSQEEVEGAGALEPADNQADALSVALSSEGGEDAGDHSVPQVSPRTFTIHAEVHPISPEHSSSRVADVKVASIFAQSKKGGPGETGKAVPSPCPLPHTRPELRKSNVVLQESDLELAVVESGSAPKCSQAERKQFMNAFKQASLEGAKGKAGKSQAKQKQSPEKVLETEEEEPEASEPVQTWSSTEQEGEKKNSKASRKTAERNSGKRNQKKTSQETLETDAVTLGVEDKEGSADKIIPPSRRELRLSTREVSRKQTPSVPAPVALPPKTQARDGAKDSNPSSQDGPASASTPKTRRSRKGVYKAEMLSPLDVKGSPIRMKFTRVFPTSATKGGDFEILSPLATQNSNASKKRKQAKKLVQKAKALQQSRQATSEDKPALRRSTRSQGSAKKSDSEDEDSVVFVEAVNGSPQAPKDKGKSLKKLRSLNEVLGKNTSLPKAIKSPAVPKVAALFLEKKHQRPSTVISIFDDNSRDGSENSQDGEQFRARREFLKSGLPESFKKQLARSAASREAYTQACASFHAVLHVQQAPRDNALWALAWPACGFLRGVREADPALEALTPAPPGPVCNTMPAQRPSHPHRLLGWREDFSECVRQRLSEEVGRSNPSFPVQRFLAHLLKKRSDHLLQAAASDPDMAEPVGGKRKRGEEVDGAAKAAKRRRSCPTEGETIVISESPPANGPSAPGTAQGDPVSEPGRRGRRSRALRCQPQEEKEPKTAVVTSSSEDQSEAPIILDSPTTDGVREDVLWTEKYQPQCSSEVIGNTASVRKLHSWLKEWKLRTDREERKKQQDKKHEDNGDDSWLAGEGAEGLEEEEELLCNTLLITGPTGVGKTAAIYACAQELGFKVFEVNSSSQRSGRQILSQLKEATQSHQVDVKGVNAHKPSYFNSYSSGSAVKPGTSPRKVNSPRRVISSPRKTPQSPRGAPTRRGKLAPTSLAGFFKSSTAKDPSSRERKAQTGCVKKSAKVEEAGSKGKELPTGLSSGAKTTADEQSKKSATSLILFEEVDVIFDDDAGFLAAIKTFMTTTKRPVILTTSDPTFSAMFDGYFEEIHFKAPPVEDVVAYLRLLCVAENVRTDVGDVSSLLRWTGCDLRQSLLHLQLWARSGGTHPCATPAPPVELKGALMSKCGDAGGMEAGSAGSAVTMPPCDTGCTESLLGLLNIHPHGQVQELLKCEFSEEDERRRCWEILAATQRRGVDLLYSNMEALLPLPIRPLSLPSFCPLSEPNPDAAQVQSPDPFPLATGAPHLSEPVTDDASPLKVSSRMKRKKQDSKTDHKDPFRSDSESESEFLSLAKPGGSPAPESDMEKEQPALHAPPMRMRRKAVLSPAERKKAKPVSQCLSSMATFFDHMSFLDSSLHCLPQQTEGACRPHTFGCGGCEIKSGMTDEFRSEHGGPGAGLQAEEIHAVLESLSFRRCRAGVAKAFKEAQDLEEEDIRQEAQEEFTLPVAPHRQSFSLTSTTLCEPRVLERREPVMEAVLSSRASGTLGNRWTAALDYLPTLRTICRSEKLKEQGKVKRRFLHYLDGIHLGLPKSTVQILSSDFP